MLKKTAMHSQFTFVHSKTQQFFRLSPSQNWQNWLDKTDFLCDQSLGWNLEFKNGSLKFETIFVFAPLKYLFYHYYSYICIVLIFKLNCLFVVVILCSYIMQPIVLLLFSNWCVLVQILLFWICCSWDAWMWFLSSYCCEY